MSQAESAETDGQEPLLRESGIRFAVLSGLIFTLPFSTKYAEYIGGSVAREDIQLIVLPRIGVTDVLLALLIVLAIPLVRQTGVSDSVSLSAAGIATVASVSMLHVLFSPSLAGFLFFFRLVGAVAVILSIQSLPTRMLGAVVAWPLAAAAAIQAIYALAQTFLWNSGAGILTTATGTIWTAGFGTTEGPYDLAAFLVFSIAVLLSMDRFSSIHPIMWASVAVSSAAVATTFGRSGLLALFIVSGAYLIVGIWSRTRILPLASFASLAPAVGTIFLLRSGWLPRVGQTARLSGSGRGRLIERAIEVIGDHPLIGVGARQYGPHLAAIKPPITDRVMVHNVPLLMTAEFGIVVGVAALAWSIVVFIRSIRTSVYTFGIFVAITPFLAFDHLHYIRTSGLVTIGLWAGLLELHWRHRERTEAQPSAAE